MARIEESAAAGDDAEATCESIANEERRPEIASGVQLVSGPCSILTRVGIFSVKQADLVRQIELGGSSFNVASVRQTECTELFSLVRLSPHSKQIW